MVFAADLEEVDDVCCGGVDCVGVLVWCWGGFGEGVYFEVEGALGMCQLRCWFEGLG